MCPFFVRGHACWVEGIGEQLSSITLEEPWYVVVFPNVHLNTQQMFADPDLTRNCSPIKIRDFLLTSNGELVDSDKMQNVFEPIARRMPQVENAFGMFKQTCASKINWFG